MGGGGFNPMQMMFLIHYGWRGTIFNADAAYRQTLVSNPLRLEGDAINGEYELIDDTGF